MHATNVIECPLRLTEFLATALVIILCLLHVLYVSCGSTMWFFCVVKKNQFYWKINEAICLSGFQPQNESGSHRNVWMRRAQKSKNLFLVRVDPIG